MDWLMIFLAQYSGYFLVVAALFIFLMMGRRWKEQAYYFAVVSLSLLLSSGIVTESIRFFLSRPRPFVTFELEPLFMKTSASFPSGHATFFFALAMAVMFFNRRAGWWFLATAFLMGVARVYAGVHYPSDILGGALIGILSACFAVFIIEPRKFRERIGRVRFMI